MTRKLLVRSVSLVLSLVLAVSVFAVGDWNTAEAASSVTALEKQQDKLNAQIKALEKELANAKKNQASAMNQKNILSSQISAYQEDIENTNSLIAAYEKQITEQEQLIVQNTADYDDLYEKLKTRIRVMYENGNVSYLEVLLTSANLSDLLSRADIVNSILDSDNEKLQDLLEARNAIEEAKQKLEDTKSSLEAKKSQLNERKTSFPKRRMRRMPCLPIFPSRSRPTSRTLPSLKQKKKRSQRKSLLLPGRLPTKSSMSEEASSGL